MIENFLPIIKQYVAKNDDFLLKENADKYFIRKETY